MNGLLLGRYQIFHKGHQALVDKALSECDKVLLFIGSAQEEKTLNNPFSFSLRKKMIEAIYQDKVLIKPLVDLGVGNVPKWGDYVYEQAHKYLPHIDVIYFGDEKKHQLWYSSNHEIETKFISLNRKIIPISASEIREAILKGDKETFYKYVDERIHPFYDELKSILDDIAKSNEFSVQIK